MRLKVGLAALALSLFVCPPALQADEADAPKASIASRSKAPLDEQSLSTELQDEMSRLGRKTGDGAPGGGAGGEELQNMLSLIENNPQDSSKYKKAVQFIEASVYNQASYESLEALAFLFQKKGDRKREIQTLEIIVRRFPENPESHYILGAGLKRQSLLYDRASDKSLELKNKAIESLSRAIQLNRKHKKAYHALLPLLRERPKDGGAAVHNHASLELVKDMILHLTDPKNYILLCEAYYETRFVKQARKACKKAYEENPEDPKSRMLAALLMEKSQDIISSVEKAAEQFPGSYFVNERAGLFFLESNKALSEKYLTRAVKLKQDSAAALTPLAWLLFKKDQIQEAYKLFFKSCIASQGKTMKDFQKAGSELVHKKTRPALQAQWRKGEDACFQRLKKEREKSKKPPK